MKFVVQSIEQLIQPTNLRKQELNTNAVIKLPPWVTYDVFLIFKNYLEETLNQKCQYKVDIMQKLLWLGDFLELSKFEQFVINKLIIPSINPANCILFLKEAYKKLNTYEDESLIGWYQMLNISMNIIAKHIENIDILQINKIDQKLLEQIIERSFKSKKTKLEKYNVIKIIRSLKIYHKLTLIQILHLRKKVITEKKIYQENSANIIKSINLKNEKKQKSTNPFTLGDYTWILITRKQTDTIKIYLKLMNRNTIINENQSTQITCVYFHSKTNKNTHQRHYSRQNLILGLQPELFVTEIQTSEYRLKNKEKIEFKMFISVDYTSSAILNYIMDNCHKYLTNELINRFEFDDLLSILQAINNPLAAIRYLAELTKFTSLIQFGQIFSQLNISTQHMKMMLEKIQFNQFFKRILIQQIQKSCLNEQKNIVNQLHLQQPFLTQENDNTILMNLNNNSRFRIQRNSRVSNKSEVSSNKKKLSIESYESIMQRIDIRNFIRSKNQDMNSHFAFIDENHF